MNRAAWLDCPRADGFVCKDSVCTWNYIGK